MSLFAGLRIQIGSNVVLVGRIPNHIMLIQKTLNGLMDRISNVFASLSRRVIFFSEDLHITDGWATGVGGGCARSQCTVCVTVCSST